MRNHEANCDKQTDPAFPCNCSRRKFKGRGSVPKRGTPARNRTVRMPDEFWARLSARARKLGISVADLLIKAGEQRLRVERRFTA